MQRKDFIRIALIVIGLLCIPLIGMLISDEVSWGVLDFVIGFVLLFSFGCLIHYALYRLKGSRYRTMIIIVIIVVLVLIWMELAVGIL